MHERRAVSRSPRELGGETHDNGVLDEILRRNVTDFLLLGGVLLSVGVEFNHFLSAKLGNVADVVHSLNLIKMHKVVSHPNVVVVVHSNVKALHCLRALTKLSNSTIDAVLSLHEFGVLCLDLVDNLRGVNVASVGVPVNRGEVISSMALSIVVVEDRLQLGVLLS